MGEEDYCARCGARIRHNTPDHLCPRCRSQTDEIGLFDRYF